MPDLVLNTGPIIALTAAVRTLGLFHELNVTSSIGILVKAARAGLVSDLTECFNRMHEKGVWVGETLKQQALDAASESKTS